MIAVAISARRQFSEMRITSAITSRTTEIVGDTIASCNKPVVVSTSPVSLDRMPPVFMSQRRGSGRCTSRSKIDRRSDNITRTFSRRCR